MKKNVLIFLIFLFLPVILKSQVRGDTAIYCLNGNWKYITDFRYYAKDSVQYYADTREIEYIDGFIYVIGSNYILPTSYNTVLHASEDNGKTWSIRNLIFKLDINDKKSKFYPKYYTMECPKKNVIYLAGDTTKFAFPTSEGTTWNTIIAKSIDNGYNFEFIDTKLKMKTAKFVMFDELNGLLLDTIHNSLFFTNDGCRSWENRLSLDGLMDISAPDKDHIFVVAEDKSTINGFQSDILFINSINGGITWDTVNNIKLNNAVNKNCKLEMTNEQDGKFACYSPLFQDTADTNLYHYYYSIYSTNDACNNLKKDTILFSDDSKINRRKFLLGSNHYDQNNVVFYGVSSTIILFRNNKWVEQATMKDSINYTTDIYNVEYLNQNEIMSCNMYSEIYHWKSEGWTSIFNDFVHKAYKTNIYPNPAHSGDMVTIDYPQYINGEILIHDIYGKHIDKVNFIGNSFRLKDGIPKGTYFIVISSNGEVLGREKFLVVE